MAVRVEPLDDSPLGPIPPRDVSPLLEKSSFICSA
jgi:hypothetical protein